MALVYWCVNKSFGTFLLMGWSANRLVNGVLTFPDFTSATTRLGVTSRKPVKHGVAMESQP